MHRNVEFHGTVSRCIADQRNPSLRPLPSSSTSPASMRWPCVSFISRTRAFFNASVATHMPPCLSLSLSLSLSLFLSFSLSLLADPLNEHKHKLVSSNRAAGRARSLRTVNWWVNLLRWSFFFTVTWFLAKEERVFYQ